MKHLLLKQTVTLRLLFTFSTHNLYCIAFTVIRPGGNEFWVFPLDHLQHQRRRDEAQYRGLLPPHAAVRDHLATGGDAPGLDGHLRQDAASHDDCPGHA